jgi:tetratricopeptide (TPR) repeat protein
VLLACTCALAQMHDHGPPAREPAVDLAKLPKPQRIEGIGHSHITITTKSAEAQQWFDQGLALLHCFWDHEALRAFEQSVRLDPNCAMRHWRLARGLRFQAGTDEQVKQELARAKELAPKTSDHEQRYIRAYAASQDGKANEFTRTMQGLLDRYPDDLEAKLIVARSGAPYANTILRSILLDYPDNAAANHYWIHAMQGSRAPGAGFGEREKAGKPCAGIGAHGAHAAAHFLQARRLRAGEGGIPRVTARRPGLYGEAARRSTRGLELRGTRLVI